MPFVRKPTVFDLNALLKGLSKARVEFILVGGVAAVVQGAPVTTFDLDIVHRQTDEKIKNRLPIYEETVRMKNENGDKI